MNPHRVYAAVCLSIATIVSAQSTLYVCDTSSQLGTVNLQDNSTAVIGDLPEFMTDIAFAPDGTLYGVSFYDLYVIDPETAQATFIGSLGQNGANALVFSANGTALLAEYNSTFLYSVNLDTGDTSLIGDMGFASAGDLAFDSKGRLFLASDHNSLVRVNPATGSAIEVGQFGFADVFGLARDNDGTMYGYSYNTIFTINLDTGAGEFLLDYTGSGLRQATGGSFIEESLTAGCNTADLELPYGVLDLADVVTFVTAFSNEDPVADIAPPAGVYDLADIVEFVGVFLVGCP